MVATPELGFAIRETLDAIDARLQPFVAGPTPPTFADEASSARAVTEPAVYDRLVAVKAAYDPTDLLVGNRVLD